MPRILEGSTEMYGGSLGFGDVKPSAESPYSCRFSPQNGRRVSAYLPPPRQPCAQPTSLSTPTDGASALQAAMRNVHIHQPYQPLAPIYSQDEHEQAYEGEVVDEVHLDHPYHPPHSDVGLSSPFSRGETVYYPSMAHQYASMDVEMMMPAPCYVTEGLDHHHHLYHDPQRDDMNHADSDEGDDDVNAVMHVLLPTSGPVHLSGFQCVVYGSPFTTILTHSLKEVWQRVIMATWPVCEGANVMRVFAGALERVRFSTVLVYGIPSDTSGTSDPPVGRPGVYDVATWLHLRVALSSKWYCRPCDVVLIRVKVSEEPSMCDYSLYATNPDGTQDAAVWEALRMEHILNPSEEMHGMEPSEEAASYQQPLQRVAAFYCRDFWDYVPPVPSRCLRQDSADPMTNSRGHPCTPPPEPEAIASVVPPNVVQKREEVGAEVRHQRRALMPPPAPSLQIPTAAAENESESVKNPRSITTKSAAPSLSSAAKPKSEWRHVQGKACGRPRQLEKNPVAPSAFLDTNLFAALGSHARSHSNDKDDAIIFNTASSPSSHATKGRKPRNDKRSRCNGPLSFTPVMTPRSTSDGAAAAPKAFETEQKPSVVNAVGQPPQRLQRPPSSEMECYPLLEKLRSLRGRARAIVERPLDARSATNAQEATDGELMKITNESQAILKESLPKLKSHAAVPPPPSKSYAAWFRVVGWSVELIAMCRVELGFRRRLPDRELHWNLAMGFISQFVSKFAEMPRCDDEMTVLDLHMLFIFLGRHAMFAALALCRSTTKKPSDIIALMMWGREKLLFHAHQAVMVLEHLLFGCCNISLPMEKRVRLASMSWAHHLLHWLAAAFAVNESVYLSFTFFAQVRICDSASLLLLACRMHELVCGFPPRDVNAFTSMLRAIVKDGTANGELSLKDIARLCTTPQQADHDGGAANEALEQTLDSVFSILERGQNVETAVSKPEMISVAVVDDEQPASFFDALLQLKLHTVVEKNCSRKPFGHLFTKLLSNVVTFGDGCTAFTSVSTRVQLIRTPGSEE